MKNYDTQFRIIDHLQTILTRTLPRCQHHPCPVFSAAGHLGKEKVANLNVAPL